MIFLPVSRLESHGDIPMGVCKYPQSVLEHVAEHCMGSLFVGVSFMSNYYDRVTQLCGYLRENLPIPVVLGGIHPLLQPEECVDFADYLCIGEGEEAQALIKGDDQDEVRNMWPVKNGQLIRGALRPLVQDLNALPFPDYELHDDYVLYEGQLIRMTPDLLQFFMQEGPVKTVTGSTYYIALTSRGCKFNCTYCCNTAIKNNYPNQQWLRYRSPRSVVEEVAGIKSKMPFIGSVFICDDSFFERSLSDLERFSSLYKQQVDLPFFCLGTPLGITEEKVALLADAGLRYVQMGIQTGSQNTARLFRRNVSNAKLISVADVLHRFSSRTLPPRYDVIVDNPFETAGDVVETIRLLSRLKRPYFIQYFCLTLLPGTELAAKAIKEGLLKDMLNDVYRKQLFNKRKNYLNVLLYLLNTPFPPLLIRFLTAKVFRFLFDRRYFEWTIVCLVRLKKRLIGAPSEGIRGILRRKR